jgi:hypothetical protein
LLIIWYKIVCSKTFIFFRSLKKGDYSGFHGRLGVTLKILMGGKIGPSPLETPISVSKYWLIKQKRSFYE